MPDAPYPARSLSAKEAEVVAWLESERRATLTPTDLATAFGWSPTTVRNNLSRLHPQGPVFPTACGWSPTTVRNVLSRLNRKGWLVRTARGRYESVLAETGGYALPSPW